MLQVTRTIFAPASWVAALILVLGTGTVTLAQESPEAAPEPATPPAEVSQDQVHSFVDAAVAVQQIEQEFGGQVQAAESEEEAQRLHQEAQAEALQAVEESGLTMDEYYSVLEAANADPQLYSTIVELMQQRLE